MNAVTWESSVSVAVSRSQPTRPNSCLCRLGNPTGVGPGGAEQQRRDREEGSGYEAEAGRSSPSIQQQQQHEEEEIRGSKHKGGDPYHILKETRHRAWPCVCSAKETQEEASMCNLTRSPFNPVVSCTRGL
ncbi:hypothetical protein LDENG_00059250 [Lucifuga dentata]|nr:hypothetical protein LDENG_00059250 [Lucifuga dentata]